MGRPVPHVRRGTGRSPPHRDPHWHLAILAVAQPRLDYGKPPSPPGGRPADLLILAAGHAWQTDAAPSPPGVRHSPSWVTLTFIQILDYSNSRDGTLPPHCSNRFSERSSRSYRI